MPFFVVVYSRRSLISVNFIHSFCHYIILLFVVNSFVCCIEHLGSDGNKMDSDSDSHLQLCISTLVTSHFRMYVIIIIIALKGAIRDFHNLLNAPRTVSNTYAQVASAQLCAKHVQHTELLSRATCRVPHGKKGQLSY